MDDDGSKLMVIKLKVGDSVGVGSEESEEFVVKIRRPKSFEMHGREV